VHIAVSVDWEGAYLSADAMDALEQFRAAHPGVPLTHMLNAAYYTKPRADAADITRQVRLALKPGDEAGLHVHAWRSLFATAGVAPRTAPSFLSRTGTLLAFADDAGFEVELGAFTVAELRAAIKKSREILAAQKIELGSSFRAAGWLAAPNVLEAARAEGFTVDLSAVPPVWFDEVEVAFLRERLIARWGAIAPTAQPYWIDTPLGRILELPNTGAMADYATAAEIEEHVLGAVRALAAAPGRPVFVHVGFHMETADEFAPRLSEALSRLRARGAPITFETVARSAELARRTLDAKRD